MDSHESTLLFFFLLQGITLLSIYLLKQSLIKKQDSILKEIYNLKKNIKTNHLYTQGRLNEIKQQIEEFFDITSDTHQAFLHQLKTSYEESINTLDSNFKEYLSLTKGFLVPLSKLIENIVDDLDRFTELKENLGEKLTDIRKVSDKTKELVAAQENLVSSYKRGFEQLMTELKSHAKNKITEQDSTNENVMAKNADSHLQKLNELHEETIGKMKNLFDGEALQNFNQNMSDVRDQLQAQLQSFNKQLDQNVKAQLSAHMKQIKPTKKAYNWFGWFNFFSFQKTKVKQNIQEHKTSASSRQFQNNKQLQSLKPNLPPITKKPELVISKISITPLYSPPPDIQGGCFYMKNLHKELSFNHDFYVIKRDKTDARKATFLFLVKNRAAVNAALVKPDIDLLTACEILEGSTINTSQIIQDSKKPGELKLENDRWKIVKKLPIKLQ